MPRSVLCGLITGLLFCCFILAAYSDVIMLDNGDRITGKIQSASNEILIIETGYAGVLSISMEAIKHIETLEPVAILVEQDHVVSGLLVPRDGIPGIETLEEWRPLPVEAMLALTRDEDELAMMLTPAAPKRWSGNVDLGGALRSGNTDTTDVKLSGAIKRSGVDNTLKLGFSIAYGEVDGTLNTRRYSGDLHWKYYVYDRLYLYTIGLAERDDGRKLDLRLQGGGGLGYDVIQREKTTLAADLGLTYTYERWAPFTPWERDQLKQQFRSGASSRFNDLLPSLVANGVWSLDNARELSRILADIRDPLRNYRRTTEDYPNLRIGFLFSQSLFKNVEISHDLTFLPNLDDVGELRALSDLAISTPITESISLRTSLKSEYDSLARRKSVEKWDHILMTELRYAF